MASFTDGPCTARFESLGLRGNVSWSDLPAGPLSQRMLDAAGQGPRGRCVFYGLPFTIGARPVLVGQGDEPVTVKLPSVKAQWLLFAHTSDLRPPEPNERGLPRTPGGEGCLGEHAADYVMIYADGTCERHAIRRRHQIGMFQWRWGDKCVQAVSHAKPKAVRAAHEQPGPPWGISQTRVHFADSPAWVYWLWAWENPHPRKPLAAVRFEPVRGTVLVAGLSAGSASALPTRWQTRRKAVLKLPRGADFDPTLDENHLLSHIQIDLGTVISAGFRPVYPNAEWAKTDQSRLPEISRREILIEYTSHPDANFHLPDGRAIPVSRLADKGKTGPLRVVEPTSRLVTFQAVEAGSRTPVPVKLHIHGQSGEYLPPVDRHRCPNPSWFEDYSVDLVHQDGHLCTYIPGQTQIKLPLGEVFIEVTKGFEIRPVRRVVRVTKATRRITVQIERILPWRQRNWVSADTHVHFLSPPTGLLEGAAEGVNVVNLLASQWGELMTNVGDFDGQTTHGSRQAGGDGEYLLRVGTENRQHVLGHISLLGYNGPIIAPMCTGGPTESALGDPVEVLLTEWARQCRQQDGLVVIPHFPYPRLEAAAAIVDAQADAVEMYAEGDGSYNGIDPYSLSDWYRYLNNGYLLAIVGGTDKMSADRAVGAMRTYARIAPDEEFTYEAWKDAVRRAETFVTCGPLTEFEVDGRPMGSRIGMSATGGTVQATWNVASVTVPMTRVELVANGEIIDGRTVGSQHGRGSFSVKVDKCTWLALLVRGQYAGRPEIIAAHSSPVMIDVAGSEFYAAADAMTILQQVEGALAYLDTVATRAEATAYRRMRLVLTSAHRTLHNRMHTVGLYHAHAPTQDHPEHHT